jgi:hypothetical protein
MPFSIAPDGPTGAAGWVAAHGAWAREELAAARNPYVMRIAVEYCKRDLPMIERLS